MAPGRPGVFLDHDGHWVDHEGRKLDINVVHVSFEDGEDFVKELGVFNTANFCEGVADPDHFLGSCVLEFLVFVD